MARLAAWVPKPRVNLTRYHGVLAPNHRWRGLVTPAKRGKDVKRIANTEGRTSAERHAAMTWAQRLTRVFKIDIEVCGRCGGSVRVIACIEDQTIIDRILDHLRNKESTSPAPPPLTPPSRAPPQTSTVFRGCNPLCHNSTSKDASRNLSAGTAEYCRSGMNEYELPVHRRKHDFREISILVVKFSDLAYGIRQEIYSQQHIYFSILRDHLIIL